MTRNEVKELLPIMQAFAEGKTIEERTIGTDNWIETDEIYGGRNNDYDYRVKPTPKYRPFKNAQECFEEMKKHQPFGWIKSGELLINIITIGAGITVHTNISNCGYSFKSAFSLRFADGTPFGILEEE